MQTNFCSITNSEILKINSKVDGYNEFLLQNKLFGGLSVFSLVRYKQGLL
jgi:hypothetical protein